MLWAGTGLRAYRGSICLVRTWLQLMCCHQTSTVLEFQTRDRWGFGGLDKEFEGQSMSISDWGAYMRIGMYKYQRIYQGNKDWAYVRVGVWVQVQGLKIGLETKMRIETETWNKTNIRNMKQRGGTEFGGRWVNGINMMTDRTDDWTRRSPTAYSMVTEIRQVLGWLRV